MSEPKDTPIGLLRELLDNSQPFYSAIECDHDFDGEKWAERARAAIDEPPLFTREDVEWCRKAFSALLTVGSRGIVVIPSGVPNLADRIEALLPPGDGS